MFKEKTVKRIFIGGIILNIIYGVCIIGAFYFGVQYVVDHGLKNIATILWEGKGK